MVEEREKNGEFEQGADGKRREREKELYRERERCWETFREEDTQRRIETHGAENQFDIGVDPYSRNVKYLSGRILSGEKAIRVMVVLLVIFILLPRRLLFILSRSGGIIRVHVTKRLISDHGGFAVCREKVGRKKEYNNKKQFFYKFFRIETQPFLIS